jgi:hypothetical protein
MPQSPDVMPQSAQDVIPIGVPVEVLTINIRKGRAQKLGIDLEGTEKPRISVVEPTALVDSLRPGDIITSVIRRPVKGAMETARTMRYAGRLDLEVWRPLRQDL